MDDQQQFTPDFTPSSFGVESQTFIAAYMRSQFLGIFGIDRFYLGYKRAGRIKLFTLGGLGVWWLLDQVLLLTGNLRPKDGSRFEDYEAYRGLAAMVFVVAWLLFAVIVWYGVSSLSRSDFPLELKNGPSTSNIAPARAATGDTPLGQTVRGSGMDAGLSVKVARLIPAPQTTGDAPDAGMKYVEVDVSVTNTGSQPTIVTGTFDYQTAAGTVLNTADTTGSRADYPNKNVQITGKSPLSDLSLEPGATDDSHYLIYQIPVADTGGKLVWYEGYYDTKSTKLAIFDLQ